MFLIVMNALVAHTLAEICSSSKQAAAQQPLDKTAL
jgi:hypothetical protein